jgi:hypothetical protein
MGLEDRKVSKTIDGVVYEVTPLPFGVGRKALMRAIRIVSPIISAAFKEGDPRATAAAIFDVLPDALSDEDVEYFAQTFGPYSQFQSGTEPTKLTTAQQDLHFAGRYYAFMQWLLFCFEANFADFFSGIKNGAGIGALLKMAK